MIGALWRAALMEGIATISVTHTGVIARNMRSTTTSARDVRPWRLKLNTRHRLRAKKNIKQTDGCCSHVDVLSVYSNN